MTSSRTPLDRHADRISCDLAAQDAAWAGNAWTRRRFIAGAGMVGAAALASQLVTTRVAYAARPRAAALTDERTLVLIFLRGGADFAAHPRTERTDPRPDLSQAGARRPGARRRRADRARRPAGLGAERTAQAAARHAVGHRRSSASCRPCRPGA